MPCDCASRHTLLYLLIPALIPQRCPSLPPPQTPNATTHPQHIPTTTTTHPPHQVLRPYQVVSIVPGCLCISRKTSLIRTLLNAFGPDVTWSIVPHTFKLPEELDEWAQWVRTHQQQVRHGVWGVGRRGCGWVYMRLCIYACVFNVPTHAPPHRPPPYHIVPHLHTLRHSNALHTHRTLVGGC